MSKVNKEAQEKRLKELIHRVHLCALKILLSKETQAIDCYQIETNMGRVNKAVRDLTEAGHIHQVSYTNSDYRPHSEHWVDTLDASLHDYEKTPSPSVGESIIREHVNELFSLNRAGAWNRKSIDSLRRVGWAVIEESDIGLLAKVWLHRDEYLFMGPAKEDQKGNYWNNIIKHYPEPQTWSACKKPQYFMRRREYESLPKILLRNVVEEYAGYMVDRLERSDMGTLGHADVKYFENHLLNITTLTPTEEHIDTALKQCQDTIKIVTEYMEQCQRLKAAVKKIGGTQPYSKDLIVRAVDDLLAQSPIILTSDKDKVEYFSRHMQWNALKETARYVLDHAELMDYNALYDDRVSVFEVPDDTIDTKNYDIDEELKDLAQGKRASNPSV